MTSFIYFSDILKKMLVKSQRL